LILLGHLLALSLPRGLVLWNSVPVRLYLLEITGLALGLWALVGLVVLLWRRFGDRRILKTSTPMDIFILLLLLVSVITGVLIATLYRFGSFWFTGVFTPYLMSLLILQPNPLLIAPLPFIIQLHAINFFILLAIFPFSRLVHIIAYPLGYLFRPWQIIVWERRQRSLKM
jgi:nitrate reductase gamma subunit